MHSTLSTAHRDIVLENVAAELTEAAYPVALRHGVLGSSIDLELDLWRVFVETVKQWQRDPHLSCEDEFDMRGRHA
jgi:hypothetical protein